MRTTLSLDDQAAAIAAQYAKARNMTLGKAVSELIVSAARGKPRIKYVDGLPVFDLGPGEEPITTEHVKELEAEGY
jgi:hypothetical protein